MGKELATAAVRFRRETRGSAAVEFVLWLAVLIVPVLSVADIGTFAFKKALVEVAGQAAVQAVWHACDANLSKVPATRNCNSPSLLTTATTAAQATTLGSGVTIASADIIEGYYCSSTTKVLTRVGAAGTLASPLTATVPTCNAVTTGSNSPAGDYISIRVSYTYAPIFQGLSVATLLGTTITHTSWMRLS